MSKSKLSLTRWEGCRELDREILVRVGCAQSKLRVERAFVQDGAQVLANGETAPAGARLDTNDDSYLFRARECVLKIQGHIPHDALIGVYLRAYWKANLDGKIGTGSDTGSRYRLIDIGILGTHRCCHDSDGNQRFN